MYDSKELYNIDDAITTRTHADEIFPSKPFYYTLRRESDILAYQFVTRNVSELGHSELKYASFELLFSEYWNKMLGYLVYISYISMLNRLA